MKTCLTWKQNGTLSATSGALRRSIRSKNARTPGSETGSNDAIVRFAPSILKFHSGINHVEPLSFIGSLYRLHDSRSVRVSSANPDRRDPLTIAVSDVGMVFHKMGYLRRFYGTEVNDPYVVTFFYPDQRLVLLLDPV